MNGAHLHLLLNHIPVFFAPLGALALLWAALKNSKEMRWTAIGLFLLTGVATWLASETGESAEDLVKVLPEVTKGLIHTHEQAADFANISAGLLSAGALGLIAVLRYKRKWLKASQIALIVIAVWSSTVMARTAYLGGQIRHTEIRNS